jgi:chitinase
MKTIGYYESWSYYKANCAWSPENLNPTLLTHLNFAFALVGPDNRIASMNAQDIGLYTRTTSLKKYNPSLKVFISVGGWDAGADGFSRMASSSANRATFISSVVGFLETYDFDGIDIDWEYPVASDRGGVEADKDNYVSLVKELRAALTWKKGVTITIPSSYCECKFSRQVLSY